MTPKVHQLAARPPAHEHMGNPSHSNHSGEPVSEFPAHQMNRDVDDDSDIASVSMTISRFYIFRSAPLYQECSLLTPIFVLSLLRVLIAIFLLECT